ncbi:hypothetical protein QBC46DRAFT_322079 [Diplogelasinospora grovesii]|uniref:Uncharacterized protein n=1 Tax=Diplogelasinospora grovesii TaxID=303347 RepID=A0AAN6S148_9PEZI|nr:hypothetical protein QBC46DRAFT_322079 [Diplogelasinospora grovesii]
MAGQPLHFWDIDGAAAPLIGNVYYRGEDYTRESDVWHAWEAIPRPYFPDRPPPGGIARYAIQREAYRGLPPSDPQAHKPDVIVVRMQNRQQQPGMPVRADERDVLWIECKAPCQDKPHGWNEVLNEAVGRLTSAHPQRKVFLILAVGMKWMPFLWDPQAQPSALNVVMANRTDSWPVDQRIHLIDAATLPGGQRHAFQSGGNWFVDTRCAYTLNYWAMGQNGQPAFAADMTLLENLFAAIQAAVYNGWNPAEFGSG